MFSYYSPLKIDAVLIYWTDNSHSFCCLPCMGIFIVSMYIDMTSESIVNRFIYHTGLSVCIYVCVILLMHSTGSQYLLNKHVIEDNGWPLINLSQCWVSLHTVFTLTTAAQSRRKWKVNGKLIWLCVCMRVCVVFDSLLAVKSALTTSLWDQITLRFVR